MHELAAQEILEIWADARQFRNTCSLFPGKDSESRSWLGLNSVETLSGLGIILIVVEFFPVSAMTEAGRGSTRKMPDPWFNIELADYKYLSGVRYSTSSVAA